MIHIFADGDKDIIISTGRKDGVNRMKISIDEAPLLAEMLIGITKNAEKLMLEDPASETWLDA